MKRTILAVSVCGAALFFLTTFAGCGDKTERSIFSAVGSYGDVAVLTPDANLYRALQPFLTEVGPEIAFGVKTEPLYRYQNFTGRDWKHGRNYRNIILAALRDDGSDVGDEIRSLLSDADLARLSGDRGGLLMLNDPYFQNQFVVVAMAPERNLLASMLRTKTAVVADSLRAVAVRRQLADNRRAGLQRMPPGEGFVLELPSGFGNLVRRPRGFPGLYWRKDDPTGRALGLSVSWMEHEDPATLLTDRGALLDFRKRVGAELQDGAAIQDEMAEWLQWTGDRLAGREVVWLRGNLYYGGDGGNVRGGPFWSWFLAAPDQGRLYCLDAWVYNPTNAALKMDDFRRLRTVLETFREEGGGP